jgi:nucleoside-diphosphate-sugar epimerase
MIATQVERSVQWLEADTRDEAALNDALKGADAAIHLAAGASFLMYEEDPIRRTAAAIQGFHTLLELSRNHDVGNIVYASTSAVYEGNSLPYHEEMALKPPDLKAFAKKVNEEMAALYSDRYGMRIIGLRPFSVYGDSEMSKGKYANVISLFAWTLCAGRRPVVWGDGSQTRDFIFAADVARAFVLAAESNLPTRVLNVGTGIETSFNEALRMLSRKLDVQIEPQYVPIPIEIYARRLLADVSLCATQLDFTAEVTLSNGMDRVLESAHRALASHAWRSLPYAQDMGPRARSLPPEA